MLLFSSIHLIQVYVDSVQFNNNVDDADICHKQSQIESHTETKPNQLLSRSAENLCHHGSSFVLNK